ncbi:MAG: alpha-ketoacid dehydrogenase subunit beta [Magnetococcales bacterium]|nr:alpha-ketoacid dehydrogenase subunit beta [Magnetococcales bacterium]
MPSSTIDNASTEKNIREINFGEALQEAQYQAMESDKSIMVIGEGVADPKSIFRTTEGLVEKFGPDRVTEMPLAENGMTGVCIGLATSGFRPILVHQRIDFALLSLDQLINNAAKLHYVFNGQVTVPLVVRMLIGRGWGQGPQHAQSLQSLFAHIPGLKVVMPTTPYDAKGMLLSAIKDNNPVMFIEHRWLYNLKGDVPKEQYLVPLDKASIVKKGSHITVATFSHMTIEAIAAAQVLAEHGVEVEIIDMRSVRPLDMDPVLASVEKTGLLMVLDTGWASCGVSGEIMARTVENAFQYLKKPPMRITLPDHPAPTSKHLADDYYPDAETIVKAIVSLVDDEQKLPTQEMCKRVRRTSLRDIPNPAYVGPF